MQCFYFLSLFFHQSCLKTKIWVSVYTKPYQTKPNQAYPASYHIGFCLYKIYIKPDHAYPVNYHLRISVL